MLKRNGDWAENVKVSKCPKCHPVFPAFLAMHPLYLWSSIGPFEREQDLLPVFIEQRSESNIVKCFDFCLSHPDDRERGRFYVCLLVGWHHWEAISQALSPKTSNGNVASHCTHSFVTAACSLLCFWLFLSTINQILVLFGEHLDITKQWCNNID